MNHPSTNAEAVNIASTDHTFTGKVRGLFVGGAGNVIVHFPGSPSGTNITFTGVVAGTILPIVIDKVIKTSTTATNMVGLY